MSKYNACLTMDSISLSMANMACSWCSHWVPSGLLYLLACSRPWDLEFMQSNQLLMVRMMSALSNSPASLKAAA